MEIMRSGAGLFRAASAAGRVQENILVIFSKDDILSIGRYIDPLYKVLVFLR